MAVDYKDVSAFAGDRYHKFSIVHTRSTPITERKIIRLIELLAGRISPALGSDMIFCCRKK